MNTIIEVFNSNLILFTKISIRRHLISGHFLRETQVGVLRAYCESTKIIHSDSRRENSFRRVDKWHDNKHLT